MICGFVLVNTFKEGDIGQSRFTKTDHCLIIFVTTYLKWTSFFIYTVRHKRRAFYSRLEVNLNSPKSS